MLGIDVIEVMLVSLNLYTYMDGLISRRQCTTIGGMDKDVYLAGVGGDDLVSYIPILKA